MNPTLHNEELSSVKSSQLCGEIYISSYKLQGSRGYLNFSFYVPLRNKVVL